ncbi:hypothetical protein N7490_004210 [Penicillium lividum]|nr:hypothetical protein N7490_004210 [Penicillium lividum]
MALKFEVYVAPQIDVNPEITLPITGAVRWSPISCTLVYGENEAILVDTPITFEQNEGLIEPLLGIPMFKRHSPGIRAVATPGTVEHMERQLEPGTWDARWAVYFAGGVPDKADVDMAEPLVDQILNVDGHEIKIIDLGQTDTHSSTALVPIASKTSELHQGIV